MFIEINIESKFGTNITIWKSPFSLIFMFFKFICPVIVNPLKYDLKIKSL